MSGTTLFPTAIDDDTVFSDDRVTGDPVRADEHDNMVAAIRAAQTEIGKTTSPAAGSLRYLLLHGTFSSEFLLPNSENATLSANTNNLAVASTTACLRLTASGANRDLTGITGGVAGRILIVRNVGATNSVILRNDVSSTAANRFLFGADLTIGPHQSVTLQWDSADNRWDLAGGSGGSGGVSTVLVFRGTYSLVTAYAPNDVVLVGNDSYVATAPSTGSQPPSVNWQLLAKGGVDGADGQDGGPGPIGPRGLIGPAGPSLEVLSIIGAAGASQTLDAGIASVWDLGLNTNCTITLEDTGGRQVSPLTVFLTQGSGGSKTVTWANVGLWLTSGATPPVLATTAGHVNVITFVQKNGTWFGFVASGSGAVVGPSIPTVDFGVWTAPAAQPTTAGQTTDYVFGTAVQVGNSRLGVVDVVTVRATSDPPIPTLTGGGASSWSVVSSQICGAGGTRRRLTRFAAWDSASGSAAPLVVGIGGISHTGCVIIGTRSAGITAATALGIMLANSATGTNTAGGSGTVATCTLTGAVGAGGSADRGLFAAMANTVAQTPTPETNWSVLQTTDMTNPAIRLIVMKNMVAFDTTPTTTYGVAVTWTVTGSEIEQG